jgi:hypothetical protein
MRDADQNLVMPDRWTGDLRELQFARRPQDHGFHMRDFPPRKVGGLKKSFAGDASFRFFQDAPPARSSVAINRD